MIYGIVESHAAIGGDRLWIGSLGENVDDPVGTPKASEAMRFDRKTAQTIARVFGGVWKVERLDQ